MPQSLAQLKKQIAKLEQQAEAIRKKEVAGVIARIREAIEHYDLTAADLGLGGRTTKAAKAAKPTQTPKGKAAKKARAGKIKFKDGQGNSWTGHGRRPQWFLAALASGKTEADLAA